MSIPNFRQTKQEDRRVQDLQAASATVFSALQQAPLANAVFVTYTVPSQTPTIPAGTDIVIAHGLNTVPRGIIPLAALQSSLAPGNASWIQSLTKPPNPAIYMVLQCSATLKSGAQANFLVF